MANSPNSKYELADIIHNLIINNMVDVKSEDDAIAGMVATSATLINSSVCIRFPDGKQFDVIVKEY